MSRHAGKDEIETFRLQDRAFRESKQRTNGLEVGRVAAKVDGCLLEDSRLCRREMFLERRVQRRTFPCAGNPPLKVCYVRGVNRIDYYSGAGYAPAVASPALANGSGTRTSTSNAGEIWV